ncbi:hypothetical protein HDU98_001779 [Podochytrium sp. JEL0797]|nr:hypothetical protein HDU98_001779 [Podochytrium sp. JEL0797]
MFSPNSINTAEPHPSSNSLDSERRLSLLDLSLQQQSPRDSFDPHSNATFLPIDTTAATHPAQWQQSPLTASPSYPFAFTSYPRQQQHHVHNVNSRITDHGSQYPQHAHSLPLQHYQHQYVNEHIADPLPSTYFFPSSELTFNGPHHQYDMLSPAQTMRLLHTPLQAPLPAPSLGWTLPQINPPPASFFFHEAPPFSQSKEETAISFPTSLHLPVPYIIRPPFATTQDHALQPPTVATPPVSLLPVERDVSSRASPASREQVTRAAKLKATLKLKSVSDNGDDGDGDDDLPGKNTEEDEFDSTDVKESPASSYLSSPNLDVRHPVKRRAPRPHPPSLGTGSNATNSRNNQRSSLTKAQKRVLKRELEINSYPSLQKFAEISEEIQMPPRKSAPPKKNRNQTKSVDSSNKMDALLAAVAASTIPVSEPPTPVASGAPPQPEFLDSWPDKYRTIPPAVYEDAFGSSPPPKAAGDSHTVPSSAPRQHVPDESLAALKQMFHMNPRPSEDDIAALSSQIGMDEKMIHIWFHNMNSYTRLTEQAPQYYEDTALSLSSTPAPYPQGRPQPYEHSPLSHHSNFSHDQQQFTGSRAYPPYTGPPPLPPHHEPPEQQEGYPYPQVTYQQYSEEYHPPGYPPLDNSQQEPRYPSYQYPPYQQGHYPSHQHAMYQYPGPQQPYQTASSYDPRAPLQQQEHYNAQQFITTQHPHEQQLLSSSPSAQHRHLDYLRRNPNEIGASEVDFSATGGRAAKLKARKSLEPSGSSDRHSADESVSSDTANRSRFDYKRSKRFIMSREHLKWLKKMFEETPFPTSDQMQHISEVVGMDRRQVRVWFQNRRAVEKRKQGA